jgi:hypothetical protein
MQLATFKRSPQTNLFAMLACLGIGISIAAYTAISTPRPNPAWQYRFARPEVGSVTRNIQREIAFHQQRIQQQPTAGLERAALAQDYLKMARATGESSWYLLAQQTAQQSLVQLPVHNYGATIVLAKVAGAKHDFKQSLALLKPLPPQAEALSLLTTTHLALGDVATARKTADTLVQRMPAIMPS